MEILLFEGSSGSSKRKRNNKFLVVATIAALGFLGSTFAASISLNGGTSVEYGQGVSSAVGCDTDIIVTPTNTFNGTVFNLETITVLDSTTVTTSATVGLGQCIGKKITIKALNSGNASIWTCDASIDSFSGGIVATAVSGTPGCANTTFSVAGNGANTNKGFAIRNSGTAIPASTVAKITLESRN
jgi:hypothetical protein